MSDNNPIETNSVIPMPNPPKARAIIVITRRELEISVWRGIGRLLAAKPVGAETEFEPGRVKFAPSLGAECESFSKLGVIFGTSAHPSRRVLGL
ncbi:hypothetical protein PAB09_02905 [Corynebacterium sp. SCR221107]|uniref:hypothetical protein n=1 Tax=Corynebacterium sp. SCR221107 TaxID=3017361 RepID=UPI0022EC2F25|nr:hypothetical protein [Corynebacterium sp. SCR221107]WBT10146.1 hypothetical protein PAB09_02905 [Corynebacterium sp. SCR221107]